MLKSYIAFDIETTGLSPSENEIIEIGALKVRDGKVQERFTAFIKPCRPISPAITNLTGITNETVASAPGYEKVLPAFLDFCGEDILIGHNVIFDYSFVKNYAGILGLAFDKYGIDTLKIAKTVHSELPSKSLGALCEHYRIVNASAHRAYHDALATAKLYQTLAHYFEDKKPQVFCPEPLVFSAPKVLPATRKQIDLLNRLTKQRKLNQEWNPSALTRNEASRLIDSILSGSSCV